MPGFKESFFSITLESFGETHSSSSLSCDHHSIRGGGGATGTGGVGATGRGCS